jgi:hypothetical protein
VVARAVERAVKEVTGVELDARLQGSND